MAVKPRYRVAAHADGRVASVREVAAGAPARLAAGPLTGSNFGSGYEAAQYQRRLFGFRPSETGINSLLVFAGATLRARARYLVRNNPYAKKAQRVFVSNLVGTGIRPSPAPADETLKSALAALWRDWAEEADADGLADLYGLQVLVGRALFDAGECFVRFRARRLSDGLTVPLQMQLLESEFCPYELNMEVAGGNQVRSGIEFNAIGQRVAYWFYKTHPGEAIIGVGDLSYTRVPAGDVLHVFEVLRPGQIRGVSWLAAAIVRAYLLDQYDDAELERKKVAALFAGFIKRPDNDPSDPPLGAQDQPAAGVADTSLNAPSEVTTGLTPGMLQVLLPGEEISFSAPADVGGNYEAFEYRVLLAMCAGMDMPYSYTTGDFTKATYASQRASLLDLRASVRQIQNAVMIHQLCRPTYRRFVGDAVLAGALAVKAGRFAAQRRDYVRADWIPPRMEWVDPQKDASAEQIAVRNGFTSREEVALSRGKTLEEIDAAIARGNESADAHGLVLDSDPRRTTTGGGAPIASAGGADQPSPDEAVPAPASGEAQDEAAAA